MFMSNRSNNGNGISVNTNLYTSCSDTCMLQVGGWNEKLSVKFSPCTGVNEEGLRQYNRDSSAQIITSLTVDNAVALLEGLKKYINPAIEAKKDASVTVAIGNGDKRKALTIAIKGDVMTATIIVGVDDDGKPVEGSSSLTHTFNTRKIMKDYDSSTGKGTEEVVQADYLNFFERIKDIHTIQQASYHTWKHGSAISNSYASKNNNNGYNNNQSYQAPVEHTTGSISDFLSEMG